MTKTKKKIIDEGEARKTPLAARDGGNVIPGDARLKGVAKMVNDLIAYDTKIAEHELALSQLVGARRILSEENIPAAMAELGLQSVQLSNGDKVSVVKTLFASISADARPEAHAWLREHGHGDLIKTEVKANFGRGEEKKAAKAAEAIRKLGVDPSANESVHPQTLKAWVREQMAVGAPIPSELFGIRDGSSTKIERKKS